MMLQLNPSLPVYTKLGKGIALFIIDYGEHWNSIWVVALHSGAIKHLDSNDVMLEENYTFGRSKPELPADWKI